MNTYHIFFHNDVDGIVSAALYLNYLKNKRTRLYPVSSFMRGERFYKFFNQIIKGKDDQKIVLDYQYHNKADIWIDHHFNSEFGECIVNNEKIHYDSKAESAAQLVRNYLISKNNNSIMSLNSYSTLNDLIKDVNMTDSCSYNSIQQVFTDKKPIIILRAYLEQLVPNNMTYCRIVEMIDRCDFDLDEAIYRLRINTYYLKELEKKALKIKNNLIISKKISLVNQKGFNRFPRYAEFLVLPNIKYCIRITNVGNNIAEFSVGYNAWHKEKNQFNIGKLIKFDYINEGGGHFNVAGGFMKDIYVERFIDDLSRILNEEEDDMEKYGVDKSDPIEQRAAELVKTGEVKNVPEGRKVVVESKLITEEEKKNGNRENQ